MYCFTVSSVVRVGRQSVWDHATRPERLNREFFPFLRMTFPKEIARLTPETVPVGRRICRSWILLFGLVPVEYDDVTLAEISTGERFVERSSMLTQRCWEHTRTLSDTPEGCRVTDQVCFLPRLPLAGLVQRPLFHLLFRYRHWRIRHLFRGGG